jgi:hypothetical protein
MSGRLNICSRTVPLSLGPRTWDYVNLRIWARRWKGLSYVEVHQEMLCTIRVLPIHRPEGYVSLSAFLPKHPVKR